MAHNPKETVTIEEAEAIIERWKASESSTLDGLVPRAVRPAFSPYDGALDALTKFYALQPSATGLRESDLMSENEARFASDVLSDGKSSEPMKLKAFEQFTWDLYHLQGTLDHTRLLEECQVRAQRGDDDAKRRLAVLDDFHQIRHRNRGYRWDRPPNRPYLPEVDPDTQLQSTLGPHLWALLIGNDKYPQSPLKGAVNDSRAWKSYLIKFLGVPKDNITHIEDADRKAMVDALYDLRDNRKIKEGDHIIFAYSGHGSSVESKYYSLEADTDLRAGSIEALCPVDRGIPSPDISDREVLLILSEVHAQTKANITVVLDCCYSGGGTRAPGDADDRLARGLAPFVDPRLIEEMFAKADENPRRRRSTISARSPDWATRTVDIYRPVLLAACQDTELAYEENMQGMFTSAVMEVLRSEQRKSLTCSGLIQAISPLKQDQKPRFDGEDAILFKIGKF